MAGGTGTDRKTAFAPRFFNVRIVTAPPAKSMRSGVISSASLSRMPVSWIDAQRVRTSRAALRAAFRKALRSEAVR